MPDAVEDLFYQMVQYLHDINGIKFEKIQSCIEEINLDYITNFIVTRENIEFVRGIGKRKSKLQKNIEKLQEFKERQEKYNTHNHIFEGRNSYEGEFYIYDNNIAFPEYVKFLKA